MLTDYPYRPALDISITCEKCKSYVPLTQLKEHRMYHSALTKLRYGTDEPKNSDLLLKRRNFVLRKMKATASNEKPVTPQLIEEVNDAYEYLKALLNGNFVELRQVREDVNTQVGGIALNCSPDCVHAVGMASSANDRWKSHMEDARAFQDCLGEDKHKCFFGMYDGYHGRFAAEVAASELHKLLLSEMIKFDPRTKSVLSGNVFGDADISHYKFERPDTMQSERVQLYDESIGIIQNIINICEGKYNELIKKMEESKKNNANDESTENLEPSRKPKKQKSPFELKMENAFSKAYYLLDILLSYGKDENSKLRWSGCSAVTCVIQDLPKEEVSKDIGDESGHGDKEDESVSGLSIGMDPPKTVGTIHLANSGNVRTVLVRGNRAYTLTKDHTPKNKKEKNRILRDGGTLSDSTKECCVNGVLLTTRGLGNHGDKLLKKCVLVEPYTMCAPVDQYAQFLIIATRGVWEVFSEKEAASILIKLLPINQIPAPCKVSSTLHSLLEEMNQRPSSQESTYRRVSFPGRGSPACRKSATGRQRSATLPSVAESYQENLSSKSSHGSDKVNDKHQTEGQGQGIRNDNSHIAEGDKSGQDGGSRSQWANVEKDQRSGSAKSVEGQGLNMDSSKGSDSKKSTDEEAANQGHSSPIGSASKQGSCRRKSRRYIDADMQTEIGSQLGDDSDDDSGNEADIDSYLENVSFPGGLSRISMVDGPPSREQLQRIQAQFMAQHLVQAALLAGARDNVSVMVVLLPGSCM